MFLGSIISAFSPSASVLFWFLVEVVLEAGNIVFIGMRLCVVYVMLRSRHAGNLVNVIVRVEGIGLPCLLIIRIIMSYFIASKQQTSFYCNAR